MLRVPVEIPAVRLRCPHCHAPTLTIENTSDQELRCSQCEQATKLSGGVIEYLGKEKRKPTSRAQRMMETPWLVRIYEGRLIRRNPGLYRLLGLGFKQESRLFRRASELKGAERVLDVACGPGNHSRKFAKAVPGGIVVGLDLSRPMLEEAGRRAREQKVRNLFFVRQDAVSLPFEDGSFDVVSCAAGLHLISPLDKALAEMRRVLAPSGRLVVSVPRRPAGETARKVSSFVEKRLGPHAFAPGELENRLREAGFENVATVYANRLWQVVKAVKASA